MRIKGFLVAMMAVFAMSTAATPASTNNLSMVTGAATSQPIGHYDFCQTHRNECGPNRNVSPAEMSDAKWGMVRSVNATVNNSITPMTDKEIYGKDEVWAYPTTAGDCEDFALLKRRILIQRGISPANLLLTVVRKPDGEGHAVLTLRTSHGDFVLDNLASNVKPWFDTPYSFIKRQSSANAGRWVTIENGRDVLVGALK
ncbi:MULTISPECIES: transglutaminase-like cysteine peptidase [unclassified Rhizobium]|uniref:transglutaminase-like cysteine peptidase n=1 Tax=unclassified Rhizobium TaxID=2613769 RepID=UPI0002716D20|nr:MULTISPECIES: transglutaminase-like cysteine peptidase [unclassified Rhizobium]MBB3398358.1 putative transglutaminase-like cysteine proteinase [Rhizobium sp. BK060]MBB4166864.1 putative transglutaminase-like cysteine proteinase [Rhizobium sp. BK538]EJL52133.1 putative periplasmic protein [Rhizobium sp. CF122]MBZ9789737.1 transglutaminase-like cysteine peptidase [Rhizobium sp. 3T7]TCM67095.1 putative transglutaminase-like cysteine proteinase [Rhizobium sp. BK068]